MTTAPRNGSMPPSRIQTDDDVNAHPITTIDTSGVSSAEIDRIIELYVRQRTAITAQQLKTLEAMSLIRDLHHHGQVTLRQAFEFLHSLDDTVQFTSTFQQLYEDSRLQFLRSEIARIYQLMQLGGRNISAEVARTLDRYSVAKRRGGFGGLKAGFELGARVGFEIPGNVIDADAHSPSQPFDGFVVGSAGTQDEFGDLDMGSP